MLEGKKLNGKQSYKDIAVVVLNYLTLRETESFLTSIVTSLPRIRQIVLYNGPPKELFASILGIVKSFR